GLTPTGKYRYKARWAYKNAQGEEILGPTLISQQWSVSAGHNAMTVSYMTTAFTRRTGVYLLIYRNEPDGPQYYLVSSRDPSSPNCPKNAPGTETITFQDTVSDALLIAREKDPGD